MVGNAMFTTVASSEAIPEPSTVTASTQRPGVDETSKEGLTAVAMALDGGCGRNELSSHDQGDRTLLRPVGANRPSCATPAHPFTQDAPSDTGRRVAEPTR